MMMMIPIANDISFRAFKEPARKGLVAATVRTAAWPPKMTLAPAISCRKSRAPHHTSGWRRTARWWQRWVVPIWRRRACCEPEVFLAMGGLQTMAFLDTNNINTLIFWLVVWNIWIIFPYIGNVIIPNCYSLHHFSEGWRAQPPTNGSWRFSRSRRSGGTSALPALLRFAEKINDWSCAK